MEFFDLLSKAAEDVGLELTKDKYDKFISYMTLLKEWNEKINLTAITEEEEIIKKHFIDSIKAFKCDEFKHNNVSIIDVGTGAGFPGLPIAIMNENVKVTLMDSLNKRIKFLDIIVNELNLKNVITVHSRAEDGARNKNYREKFDIATSRAVANMSVLSEYCIPYVKLGGKFIALKGPAVTEEIEESRNAIIKLGGKLEGIISVNIEGAHLQHNLVVVKKIKETSKTYPRKAGTISKNPIK